MSSRDRLNYKKAMFNLRRERNVGHHITLQESNSLRLADERMKDELARNILDFGETEDTVPTREDSIREEIVLEQDVLPVNLATATDPSVGPTRLPRTGQLTPISGDLPRPTGDARGPNTTSAAGQAATGRNSARAVYGSLLTNVATLIGRAAEPTSPNTILGALSATADNSSTSGTTPAPGATPAPARAQLSIITGGTQIQRNPPEVVAANGKMYQLTLTQAGLNRGANFDAVLTVIKTHIANASKNSFGGTDFSNIVQVVAGAGGTIIARFPWADAQQANLREKITEALRNAQRGELLRLGQITLIELPGDVRGETAETTTGTSGGTTPAPAPLSSISPRKGTTRAGILISGGVGRDEVWQVEVRILGQPVQQVYTGPGSSEYMQLSPAIISDAILKGINEIFGQNNDNACVLSPTGNGYLLTYVPTPAALYIGADTDPVKNVELYNRLREAMDRSQGTLQGYQAGVNFRILLPNEPGYNTAVIQPGTTIPTYYQRGIRIITGGIQGIQQGTREIYNQVVQESYNRKNSLLSTRLQQLAGIIKEQITLPTGQSAVVTNPSASTPTAQSLGTTFTRQPSLGTTFTRQPAASAPAPASRPTATATARPAAPAPSNPNINAMIDRAIENARRIAPQVTQLASNPAYSANRQKLQQLAQYLTGEFISSMNAAKNAPDTARKLRAIQAIYTPPNRGALLSNGLFDLARLAASERR